ncbi:MAG: TusE/DsrC/DsvC family sulfur relay protein [Candidatus Izemoplasmatales bacterium]
MIREISSKSYWTDEDGYLMNIEDWDEIWAQELAKDEEIELTPEHWQVINALHSFFVSYSLVPPIRIFKEETGVSPRRIYELFPSGPIKGACRMAGLPKPKGCI